MNIVVVSFAVWAAILVPDFLPVGALVVPHARIRQPEQIEPYLPREGDFIFYDDRSAVWTPLFAMAGTGPPLHMGMVVRKSDGRFAVLEAGPDDSVWVKLLDLGPRLKQFHDDFPKGTITIRRCKTLLSTEQSAALTKFAHAQNGKRYAVLRLLAQGTSLRCAARSSHTSARPICSAIRGCARSCRWRVRPSPVCWTASRFTPTPPIRATWSITSGTIWAASGKTRRRGSRGK